ncbi:MAG: DUF1150 family protein [Alphaproteobacteria bacterium]
MNPFEYLTPWKDMAAILINAGKLSSNDFSRLGLTKIIYFKIQQKEDETIFKIFSAEGQKIFETADMNTALDWVLEHDLTPVSVH